MGGPCPEEDWFGSLLILFFSPPFSPHPPPPHPLPPFSHRVSFFLHLCLPPFQRSANAARDDNERRNPAGISARDKRTLTAYEQASALMVPTLHCRPTGFLSLSPAPFHLFFHMLLPPIYLLLPLPPSVAYLSFSTDGPPVLLSVVRTHENNKYFFLDF